MSSNAYRGALLGIVAALLLANPMYVGLVVDDPEPRSSTGYTDTESRSQTGYTDTEITLTNATDQRLLITHPGDDFGFSAKSLASLALSGLGILALFGSVAFTREATWRR